MVYILLIEDVNLTVATPRPGDDLVLSSLKHDDRRIPESGTTDSSVGVISDVPEVTKHDMICEKGGQRIGLMRDVIR